MSAGEQATYPELRCVIRLASTDFPPLRGRRQAEVLMAVERRSGGFMMMRKRSYPRSAYRLPTGGIGSGEAVLDALRRETEEETGLQVEVLRHLADLHYECSRRQRELYRSHIFHVREVSGDFGTRDTSEGIDSWLEVDLEGIARQGEVLCDLRERGAGPYDWFDWGRFRALGHRVAVLMMNARVPPTPADVAEALSAGLEEFVVGFPAITLGDAG